MAPSNSFYRIFGEMHRHPPSASEARIYINMLKQRIEDIDPYTKRKDRFPSYSVTVDYDQTIEKYIENSKYKYFDDKITSSHFPSTESGVAEVKIYLLYLYSDNLLDDDVNGTNFLDYVGLRPAILKELLALGSAYPDLQRTDSIVALGSKWVNKDGHSEVPYLHDLDYQVLVCPEWFVFFDSSWQFAAVAKDEKLTKN